MEKVDSKEKHERGARREKLGIALSGGGFRASFFHIGVLAQLADRGLLRHVEVISTVSGGSIIGALYYVYLKQLLESKSDGTITDADYQMLVRDMIEHFLRVVQMNLRLHTFMNPYKNLKMCLPCYSRSDHIGELYDKYLYRPVLGAEGGGMVEMRQLYICPRDAKGERQTEFFPLSDNEGRAAKVPVLVVNATTVNTGHNWRFEASHMGEPPRDHVVQREVDKNMRLRRAGSYEDIINRQQNIELGLAVAASAAVPAIFPPLAITGMYTDIRVQLVDGGVHDNQGVQGLIDPEVNCSHVVVSDASGQLQDDVNPPTDAFMIMLRSNDALMDRVREEQLEQLLQARGARAALMHLRRGLSSSAIAWLRPSGVPAAPPGSVPCPSGPTSAFNVTEEVQDSLSRIRTDLDSFSDIEAFALMADGYTMSAQPLQALAAGCPWLRPGTGGPPAVAQWRFSEVAGWMSNPNQRGYDRFLEHLKIGQSKFFRVFKLSNFLTFFSFAAVAAAGTCVWLYFGGQIREWMNVKVSWGALILAALAVGASYLLPKAGRTFKVLASIRTPAEVALRFLGLLLVSVFGAALVWLYLNTFGRIYLWMGRVKRLG